ncbi:MAG: hypothetical protein AABZ60_06315, partial [Planctomycetota bacterium]
MTDPNLLNTPSAQPSSSGIPTPGKELNPIQTIIEVPSPETNATVLINSASPSDIHESKTILTPSHPLSPKSASSLFKKPPGTSPKNPPVKKVSKH